MHFGLYLKNKGLISADQLVSAAEIQLTTLTRIGQLALEEGIMGPRDIFEVLCAQSEMPNKRFGDMAIEMGLMTRDELVRLLMIQTDRKRPIADILVSQGVLTKEQVAREMNEYRGALAKRRMDRALPSKIAAAVRRQNVLPPKIEVTSAV
jgi:hypothetical protein